MIEKNIQEEINITGNNEMLKKGKMMKRKYMWILAVSLMTGLTGCTAESTPSEENMTVTEDAETEDTENKENTLEVTEENTEDTESIEQNNNTEGKVTITYETVQNDRTLEDGTVIVYVSYQRPEVMIEGNNDAAGAIKQDFDSDEEDFNIRGDEIEAEAKAHFTDGVSEDTPAFANSVEYADKRADSRVVSFERMNYSNLGGAHGNTYVSGLNFDAQTGARLNIDDIVENREDFIASAKEYVLSLCESDEYHELLNPDYQESLEYILQDDLWYFDQEGITFIANTYELAAYAAGTLRFNVPYEELSGLKAEYKQ